MRMFDAFAATAAELDPLDKTDELCCVFAYDWLERVYGRDPLRRNAGLHLWMLYAEPVATRDPWGPVTACVKAGIADSMAVAKPGDVVALAPGWNRVQGWRGTPFAPGVTGHTITVLVSSTPGAEVLVFDSAKDRNEKVQYVDWPTYAKQYVGGQAACLLKGV